MTSTLNTFFRPIAYTPRETVVKRKRQFIGRFFYPCSFCFALSVVITGSYVYQQRVKPQTIYTWAQDKKIPAAKLGKEWRFKKSMIDEWFVRHIDEKFTDVLNACRKKHEE